MNVKLYKYGKGIKFIWTLLHYKKFARKMTSLTLEKLQDIVKVNPKAYTRYLDLNNTLNLCGMSLTDIEGIVHCTQLRALYADDNRT